jgi:hypothetical protein
VERSIAWLIGPKGRCRKLRCRGTLNGDLWLHLRMAGLNLRRLLNLGLRRNYGDQAGSSGDQGCCEGRGWCPGWVSGRGGERQLGDGLEGDFLTHGFQLADEVALAGLGVVATGEVVAAEVLVVDVVGQQMPDDH